MPTPDQKALCDEVASIIETLEYGSASGDFNMSSFGHYCGTPSCLAGWIVATKHNEEYVLPLSDEVSIDHWNGAIIDLQYRAAIAIGLTPFGPENRDLFIPKVYDEIGEVYVADCDADRDDPGFISPARAAAVLRHYGETGKIDWRIYE